MLPKMGQWTLLRRGKKIAFLIILYGCNDSIVDKNSPTGYMNNVFEVIQKNSIRRDSINFPKLKEEIFTEVDKVRTIKECHTIVKSLLKKLGDNHSLFLEKEEFKTWHTNKSKDDNSSPITFSGELLNEKIGYLRLNEFMYGDAKSIGRYADSLQKLIKSLDKKETKGWIIDLRYDAGGNCWPMLAGLGPLLEEGRLGYFIDANKQKHSYYYCNGAAGINTQAKIEIKEPYRLINKHPPIAVLTGHGTASSGEVVVISFCGNLNTKSFGEETYGLSSSNAPFILLDSSVIFLTSAYDADRNGKIYGRKIIPDSIVENPFDINRNNDLVIDAAKKWIIGFKKMKN